MNRFVWEPLGSVLAALWIGLLESSDRVVCRWANVTGDEDER